MNTARNPITPQNGEAQGRARGGHAQLELPGDPHAIDWQVLRSRLFAARDRLGVLGADARAERLHLRGSFESCAASMLDGYETSSRDVNRDASSNGKPAQGRDQSVADMSTKGERG